MSFKKIKVISPEEYLSGVKNPEKGYIYLGYGYSSTYGDTAPWVKKDDGSIFLISGGTGGGGISYWQLGGDNLKPVDSAYTVTIGTNSTGEQRINIGGAINLGDANVVPVLDTAGSIKYDNHNFYGNTGGTANDWVSLTERGGSTPIDRLWEEYTGGGGTVEGIKNLSGYVWCKDKTFIGGAYGTTTSDMLSVEGGVTLKDSKQTNDGTIRYTDPGTGTYDLEGRINGGWVSLTSENSHDAEINEFIYNDDYDNLVGAGTLKYSVDGIGIYTSAPKSYLEVNGSFGTKTTLIVATPDTLDETHKTILWNYQLNGTINLPNPIDSPNREYDIVKLSLSTLYLSGKINMYGTVYNNAFFMNSNTNKINSIRIKALGDTWYVINMTILPQPTSYWIADDYEVNINHNIQFTDMSTGPITSWVWYWGDGTSSTFTLQTNPTHSWSSSATRTVTLTVTGPGGSHSYSNDVHITTPA
jgi:hypothetical protein